MNSSIGTPGPAGPSRVPADLALAGLVVAVIVMMALPLPPWSLDMLVAVNISLAVVLLLVAMFIPTPLAFSSFPAVLLVTTLFRISLNVATTRQILLHAHAGDIIDAFGRLVVGGSLVVGLVVFLIITVVQFIVIAKGAERVAEVSARFTLDAMPGKQMSIDADLRAGVLSQQQAVQRRRELVQESQFYGAMDGAMKFVKGDAIAGIVIVLVNLLGGIAIGTLAMGLGFGAAVQKFSVLSIGDGLVTQIPALFVSIAAGIAITRSESDGAASLGDQIGRQLGSQPRALALASGVMALFAVVPGFPTMTFLILAGLLAATSAALSARERRVMAGVATLQVFSAAREGDGTPVLLQAGRTTDLPASSFRLELGSALAARLGAPALDTALRAERERLRHDYGIPFPGLALQIVDSMPPDACAVIVQDLPEARFELPEGVALAIGQPAADADGEGAPPESLPPAKLFPSARWVRSEQAPALREQGVTVLEAAAIVARGAIAAIQRNPAAALGAQQVRQLVREAEARFPDLVREAQGVLPLPKIADLMVALARERVPLTDFTGLLQAVLTYAPAASDLHTLYEQVRKALARSIVARQIAGSGAEDLPALRLDPGIESALRTALVVQPDGPVLAVEPQQLEAFLKAIRQGLTHPDLQRAPTLLLPVDLRRAVSRLMRGALPEVAFVSFDELQASERSPRLVATASLQAQN
ncbi:MAG: FHIPEP family type III secretion protein [Pseudomonadota bacterium]|jgi:type III secretion protein V|nr:FHIPEP family type III secretion protein [Rubrivivax sp.]MCA3260008.1 FHIPEP family type III secretion protein [Rubrivivax sp.]MCZ8032386.1 flagellar biosynthesis protein FlhA [Rubrivivax sp.]